MLVSRSEITSAWALIGTVVVAAGLLSIYAVANFADSSHINTSETSCTDSALPKAGWQEGARAREIAANLVRCGRLQGSTGAGVRALLGPPDRRTGTSSDRAWIYGNAPTPTLSIRFHDGRATTVRAASE